MLAKQSTKYIRPQIVAKLLQTISKIGSKCTLPKGENKRTLIIIMWYIYLAIIVALLLIYWWKHFARKPHPKFPPGPVGLPILGYVPIFQAKNIIEGLDTLHDKYGDVISLNLG